MSKYGGIFSGLRKLDEKETIVPLNGFSFSRLPEKMDYLDRLTSLRDGARMPGRDDIESRITLVCNSIEQELGLSKELS